MIRTSAFCLALLLLLSACSNQFGLMKRRYTKGYYASSSKKNHSTKQEMLAHAAVAAKVQDSPVKTEVVTAPVQTLPEANELQQRQPLKALAQAPARAKQMVKPVPQASASQQPLAMLPQVKSLVMPAHPAHLPQPAVDRSDALLIVMVILCFLWWFNLIAVYLHDDAFTLNFLITFLLDFTIIGGIIFSLLVVLDIVDLRK